MNKSTEMNERELKSLRKAYNECAGHYLCEPDQDDLELSNVKDHYDQYKLLVAMSEAGHGNEQAADFVTVWQPLEGNTVDYIIDLIDSSMPVENSNLPEFMKNIDWELLKKQKLSLLETITYLEKNSLPKDFTDDLTGIVHLIDSLQDYAVDDCGLEEDQVFQLSHEGDE